MEIERVSHVFTPLSSQRVEEKDVEFNGFKDKMTVLLTNY